MSKIKFSRSKVFVKVGDSIISTTGISFSNIVAEIAKENNIKKTTVSNVLYRYLRTGKIPKPGTISHLCITEMQKIFNEGLSKNEN